MASNFSIDAVAFSSTENSFCKSIAKGVPTGPSKITTGFTVPSAQNTLIPATTFGAGSGLYTLTLQATGGTAPGYTMSSTGYVTIGAGGAYTIATGFAAQATFSGTPPSSTNYCQLVCVNGTDITVQQVNAGATALNFTIVATKISN
jgi:hypothetical protein